MLWSLWHNFDFIRSDLMCYHDWLLLLLLPLLLLLDAIKRMRLKLVTLKALTLSSFKNVQVGKLCHCELKWLLIQAAVNCLIWLNLQRCCHLICHHLSLVLFFDILLGISFNNAQFYQIFKTFSEYFDEMCGTFLRHLQIKKNIHSFHTDSISMFVCVSCLFNQIFSAGLLNPFLIFFEILFR